MCGKTGELCRGITHLNRKFELLSVFFIQIAVFTRGISWVVADRDQGKNCNIIRAREIIIADCASKGLHLDVPQDLEAQLQILNLSHNRIVNVSDRSFHKYQDSLTTLDMSFLKKGLNRENTNTNIEFSVDSFSGLSKLEYLDLTNSCWSTSFILPGEIRILKIENCSTVLNVSYLHMLEEFHAAGNEWSVTPNFHNLAPLKHIDLRRNALLTFDIEKIAPFCDLRVLRLDGFPANVLKREKHTEKTYCTCKAIVSWLTNFKVEHDHWDCLPPLNASFAPKCDLTPSEDALRLRRECLSKKIMKSSTFNVNWWMFILGVVMILGLLFGALVVNGVKTTLRKGRARKAKIRHSVEEEEVVEEVDTD